MLCSEHRIKCAKKIHLGGIPPVLHDTRLLTGPDQGGYNTNIESRHQSGETTINQLWQSLGNINVLQVLWGLVCNGSEYKQVMHLLQRTVPRVLCHSVHNTA